MRSIAVFVLGLTMVGAVRAQERPPHQPIHPSDRYFTPDQLRSALEQSPSPQNSLMRSMAEKMLQNPEQVKELARLARKIFPEGTEPPPAIKNLAEQLANDPKLRQQLENNPEFRKMAEQLAKEFPEFARPESRRGPPGKLELPPPPDWERIKANRTAAPGGSPPKTGPNQPGQSGPGGDQASGQTAAQRFQSMMDRLMNRRQDQGDAKRPEGEPKRSTGQSGRPRQDGRSPTEPSLPGGGNGAFTQQIDHATGALRRLQSAFGNSPTLDGAIRTLESESRRSGPSLGPIRPPSQLTAVQTGATRWFGEINRNMNRVGRRVGGITRNLGARMPSMPKLSVPKFLRPSVPRIPRPSLPRFSPPSLSMPSVNTGQASSALATGLAVILGLAGVAYLFYWLSRQPILTRTVRQLRLRRLGDFDFDDRVTIQRAFEDLAVVTLGDSARPNHHRQIANRLAADEPTRQQAATDLADLYEIARYSPPDEPLQPEAIESARRDYKLLARNGLPAKTI